ncbi:hypothetical protein IEQ34_021967 [Dendrobium chrysotoxum]|uniref:Uncharacterized protein n=1 Tax=Dendrobium chrysotoxum TaxID=161865 RepID=A0AAV7FWC4_DENCH|nr:hypothetical protein IEQ34_021967 [Dendrobium chrysotoxum]
MVYQNWKARNMFIHGINGCSPVTITAQIDMGNKIQFGLGFTTIELTLNGKKILDLNDVEVDNPVLELVLGLGPDSLKPNKKEGGYKAIIEALEVRSIFEKGSGSGILFTSKNQKKNFMRRVMRKFAKSYKVVKVKTLTQVELEAIEDMHIPASSPLL